MLTYKTVSLRLPVANYYKSVSKISRIILGVTKIMFTSLAHNIYLVQLIVPGVYLIARIVDNQIIKQLL